MGKKKSKVARQKQTRARGNKSKLGGVTVIKGLSSKSNNNKSEPGGDAMMRMVHQHPAKKHGKTLAVKGKHKMMKRKGNGFFAPKDSDTCPKDKDKKDAHSSSNNDEQRDFQLQMAALQERQKVSNFKNKNKKRYGKKNDNHKDSAVQLQPASFSFAPAATGPPSTQALMQETVSQLQAMTGVGAAHATPVRTNQSWAMGHQQSSNNESNNRLSTSQNNPFAALDEESDGDDPAAPTWPALVHNMAPATFSLLPRTTPTPATTPLRGLSLEDDEEDPDL